MDSLNLLKQELINQKTLLDQKGFPVTTANTNPSPSEITSAIESINVNFALADASPQDVALGKTFYAQTGDLKTGTLDVEDLQKINDVALRLITSEGSAEIYIPTDSKYNQIRNYAYGNMIDDNSSLNVELYNENLFYKHNLIIPSNIIRIGNNAFLNANITGKITVPLTCQELGVGAFRGTNISEVVIYSGFTSNNASAYAFANCPNLTKATICEPVSILPSFAFNESTALEEVYLPTTITNLSTSCFYKIYNVKFVKFTGQTPPVISSNTFKYAKTASLLVPYQQFDAYNTTTNLLTFGNPIYGYGEFNTGDTLPSSISGYTIAWYPTLDDAQNSTNSITTCPNSGTMYAVCTPA